MPVCHGRNRALLLLCSATVVADFCPMSNRVLASESPLRGSRRAEPVLAGCITWLWLVRLVLDCLMPPASQLPAAQSTHESRRHALACVENLHPQLCSRSHGARPMPMSIPKTAASILIAPLFRASGGLNRHRPRPASDEVDDARSLRRRTTTGGSEKCKNAGVPAGSSVVSWKEIGNEGISVLAGDCQL